MMATVWFEFKRFELLNRQNKQQKESFEKTLEVYGFWFTVVIQALENLAQDKGKGPSINDVLS